jgi:hypothetical protein
METKQPTIDVKEIFNSYKELEPKQIDYIKSR